MNPVSVFHVTMIPMEACSGMTSREGGKGSQGTTGCIHRVHKKESQRIWQEAGGHKVKEERKNAYLNRNRNKGVRRAWRWNGMNIRCKIRRTKNAHPLPLQANLAHKKVQVSPKVLFRSAIRVSSAALDRRPPPTQRPEFDLLIFSKSLSTASLNSLGLSSVCEELFVGVE